MAIADHLTSARFYGSKSESIDAVEVIESGDVAGYELALARVNHGGTHDIYQLLIDADGADHLADSDVAKDYGRALAAGELPLGRVEGDVKATARLAASTSAKAISGEQSNTSLIFDDLMVKVFRKLEPGINPDVELLSKIPACPNIAPVRAWVTEDIGGETYTLAMVQDFVPGAKDGWAYALEHSAAATSFGDDARALGRATRTVHTHLAEAFGVQTVPAAQIAAALEEHLDYLISKAAVLAQFGDAARARYAALSRLGDVRVQRIHGDLHLGQTLRMADGRYILIDFEGEPARPLEERRLPDTPLRDVAGMIRSLDYAAHFPDFAGQRAGGGQDAGAYEWFREASGSFMDGYGFDGEPADRQLLDAYVLDKALYEVVYEANNRPDWVEIPLAAVRRILG